MVLWPCCPGVASPPPAQGTGSMLHHPGRWEGGRKVSWSSPDRSCCAWGSQLTSKLLGSASPPACQHQPLPPTLALGLVQIPQKRNNAETHSVLDAWVLLAPSSSAPHPRTPSWQGQAGGSASAGSTRQDQLHPGVQPSPPSPPWGMQLWGADQEGHLGWMNRAETPRSRIK